MKYHASLPVVLLIAGGTLTARVATAQRPDTTQLEPVVVTATRVPTPVSSVTQPVTVLNGDDLRARGVSNVADALREVPGADIAQSGSYGAVTSLFMRGGESRYTKVLVDGVPVNAVGGALYLQNFTTDNIDRIEVVSGPASALYGADAMSGVIQIFTRRGRGAPTVDASVRGGSYGTRDASLSLQGGASRATYSVGGGWHDTDGVASFNNGYSNGTLSGAFTFIPDAVSTIRMTSRYNGSIYHFPTDANGVPNDTNSYTNEHRLMVSAEASRALAPWLTLRLLGADNEIHNLSEDTQRAGTTGFVKTSSPSDGYRRRGEARVEAAWAHVGAVTVGSDYEVERERSRLFTYSYQTTPADVQPVITPGGDDSRTTRGYYVAVQGTPLPGVSIDASARYDDHSDYDNVTTYHAGAAVALWRGARLRASYGTGFNAPAFYQTQGSAYNRPNASLQPEQVHTLDVGLEQSLFDGRVHATAGAFDQRFSQLIQYVSGITTGPPDYTPVEPAYYDNLTQARSKGYEAEATVDFRNGLTAAASYTQVLASVYAVPPGYAGSLMPGDALLRRPSHSGTAALNYRARRGWSVGANAAYVGERPDMDFSQFPSPTVTLPSYVRLDMSASVDVLRNGARTVALTARVENALDKQYQDVLHFPAPGRAVLLGVRISSPVQ